MKVQSCVKKCELVIMFDVFSSESFGQNFPEDFDGTLDCVSIAITCAFNRQGTLLAVGCNDGRIVIWDFLTRGIAKFINAHVHPVCSLRSAQVYTCFLFSSSFFWCGTKNMTTIPVCVSLSHTTVLILC